MPPKLQQVLHQTPMRDKASPMQLFAILLLFDVLNSKKKTLKHCSYVDPWSKPFFFLSSPEPQSTNKLHSKSWRAWPTMHALQIEICNKWNRRYQIPFDKTMAAAAVQHVQDMDIVWQCSIHLTSRIRSLLEFNITNSAHIHHQVYEENAVNRSCCAMNWHSERGE